jgi:uncharacterized membrane protein
MNGAHLHLLLNHLPVLGTAFGLVLFLFAWLRKSREVKQVSLGVFVLAALSAVPAYLTGEPAEEVAEHLPGVTEALIEQHESAALVALSVAIATGVVALAGLFLTWRNKQLPHWQLPSWLALATLFLALTTGGLMARTANIGGQIRHTEIRQNATPATPAEKTGAEAKQKAEEKEEHE